MIPRPINDVTVEDLQALIDGEREEGVQLDFKRQLPKEDKDARKALIADVCALANTNGGDLVFGMIEQDGVAFELAPEPIAEGVDSLTLRIENVLRDGIEPQLFGVRVRDIEVSPGHYCLVIRVPPSSAAIHRSKKDLHFYVRRSRSNEPLDVPGLVTQVSQFLGRAEKVDSFFASRYANLLTDRHAIWMTQGPKLVLHLLPARDFLEGGTGDVWNLDEAQIPLLAEPYGKSSRSTHEGRAFYASEDGRARQFTLVLPSGVVEAALALWSADQEQHRRVVNLSALEHAALGLIKSCLGSNQLQALLGSPALVRMALLGTHFQAAESGGHTDRHINSFEPPFRQPLPILVLPEVLLPNPACDVEHLMHQAFLSMWRAWGYSESWSYHQKDGVWRRRWK